jgi:hypothetical protein
MVTIASVVLQEKCSIPSSEGLDMVVLCDWQKIRESGEVS